MMRRSRGAAQPSIAELAAFASLFVWIACVLFVFVWLLIPESGAGSFVNHVSLLACFDCEGVLNAFGQAASSFGLGAPLGIAGAFASRAAMRATAHPGLIVVALVLNIAIAIAGVVTIAVIAMARLGR